MPIVFRCQNCQKRSSVSSRKAGQSVDCPRCHKPTLVVPLQEPEQLATVNNPVQKSPEPSSSTKAREAEQFDDLDVLDLDDESTEAPAHVAISDAGGPMGTRPLSKSAALTFGRHMTNDVVVDEDNVSPLHCRISWNGTGFEVTSAHKGGIELNGTLVQSRVLKYGDVLRIGSFDVAFVPEGADSKATPAKGSPAVSSGKDSPRAGKPAMAELIDDDLVADDDVLGVDDLEEARDSDADDDQPRRTSSVAASRARLGNAGEENVLRSRIVLALGGTGIVLTLASIVFWFLVSGAKIQAEFDAAKAELGQGQFASGIKRMESFLEHHKGHALTSGPTGAVVLRDKALIEKEITGATNWAEGLKALKAFVQDHRDEKYFEDLREELATFSKTIATGTPKTAAQTKDRSLLELAVEAEQFFDRFSPPDTPQTEAKREFAKARNEAEATILKASVLTEDFAQIDAAIKANTPFPVVVTRRKLIVRYPDMISDKRLEATLRKTLDLAKQLVVREEINRDALTDDPTKSIAKPLTLAVRTRALSEEQSANRVVLALGQDGCFALDSVTGDPLWKRAVGLDTPFFPAPVETSRSALLTYDTSRQELLMLDRRTGDLLWRQAIEPVAGQPLILQGQIYLPTVEGSLYRIDADSGRITSRLKFPQKLLSPPIAMADGLHLLVIGDSEFVYTLKLNPLECQLVSHIGHQSGTINAVPLAMGGYVILAENDQANSSRLRTIAAPNPDQRWADVAEARLEGHVRDDLILRGNQLFVMSSGPRLSVFNVSDDKNQRTLAPIASLQIPTNFNGVGHLAAGTDGQIWMAIGALRKVQLKTDVLQLDQQSVAVGQSTQPVQMIGRSLYIGRQLPISQAVHLTQTDGESMQSNWKTVVGSSILATAPGADGQLVCATNGGDTFLISAAEVTAGGFRSRAEQQLKLPDNPTDTLQGTPLSEGRLAVWLSGTDGKLWVIGPTGLPQAEVPLPQSLECAPLRFAGGVVLPLPGKLKLAGRASGPPCDDFLAPVSTTDEGPARKWKHLIAIDDDTMFVIDNGGKMHKLQYRTGAKCFFQTVSSMAFAQPIDVTPTLHKGLLITADAAGTLRVLDVTAMETRAEIALGGPASKPLWVTEPLLLAEVGRQKLVAFDATQPKQPLWSMDLAGNGIVGSPQVIGNVLIVVQQNGDVLRIDAKSGEIQKKLSLGQVATHGPIPLGSLLTVITADGSLHHVESLVSDLPQPKTAKIEPAPTAKPAEEKPATEKAPEDKPKSDDKPASEKAE